LRPFHSASWTNVTASRSDSQAYELSEADTQAIQALVEKRLWHLGVEFWLLTPLQLSTVSSNPTVAISTSIMDVNDGIITACKIYGDFFIWKTLMRWSRL
jgi:hypothetical protein